MVSGDHQKGALVMGQILGGFLIVFLIGKLIQKLLAKFTSLEPKKALVISTVVSAIFCSLVAFFSMGASSFIIYPIAGIGTWLYDARRL
jgi:fucose permease